MPGNGDLHFQRGVLFDKRKETEKAIAAFREAIKADPKHANAYNYLGYLFADRGTNLDEAVTLIQKAIALEPDNGFFVDSLGWAYFQKGMIPEALEQMERAASLVSDDPVILEHLGDIRLKAGKTERPWRRGARRSRSPRTTPRSSRRSSMLKSPRHSGSRRPRRRCDRCRRLLGFAGCAAQRPGRRVRRRLPARSIGRCSATTRG